MIIACPACLTRYVVPDTAIGADGRTVRCAKCRHSWYQDGPPLAAPERAEVLAEPTAAAPAPAPAQPPPAAAPEPAAMAQEVAPSAGVDWMKSPLPQTAAEPAFAPDPAPVPQPEPEIPALAEDAVPPSVYGNEAGTDDDRSSFEYEPPFRPRRNMARMWTVAAVIFALVALAAAGAVYWFGLPNWVKVAPATFAEAQPGLQLDFPRNRQVRRTLSNGAEFYGASGTITNTGTTRRTVPTILIVLRDRADKIVYSWEVAPPKPQLAPGESMTINEAVTDVPRSARFAEIGWKPG